MEICNRLPVVPHDDVNRECPECGHYYALHVGAKQCPVCVLEKFNVDTADAFGKLFKSLGG